MGFLFDVSEERYDDIADRLAGGEDVNQADGSGNTALHLAAEKGIVKMVEVLLKNGAYLSCANKSTGRDEHNNFLQMVQLVKH
jgi:ankyrin repeat protein